MTEPTDVLIVGAGLAGLSLASHLAGTDRSIQSAAQTVKVVEARDRVGGRILTAALEGAPFDFGPAWFWEGQPRMAGLIEELGLTAFQQYSNGDGTYEDATGRVIRGPGVASMAGSLRVEGGLSKLTDGLLNGLPPGAVQLNRRVSGMRRDGDTIEVQFRDAPPERARVVVLALPPRLAAAFRYEPAVPEAQVMNTIPTWMGGQAKVVAVYERAFWREAGLSGDAMSQRGPLAEIHDASPRTGEPGALFGFVGRRDRTPDRLLEDARAQLVRLFGPDASAPRAIKLVDWAEHDTTSAPADRAPLRAHPRYGLPDALRGLWDGRLLLASTEASASFGGYLEGALEAAATAAAEVRRQVESG